MTDNLTKMFEMVSSYSRRYRRAHETADFTEPWEQMAPFFAEHDRPFKRWSPEITEGGMIYSMIYNKALNLPERVITGKGNQELIEQNHFMIQVFKIPNVEPSTLTNLMRVACFIGLLTAKMAQRDFPEGMVHTLKSLHVLTLISFINDSEIEQLAVTNDELKELKKLLQSR